jgi:hydantoinase/carbamoylase family amidase
MGMSHVKDALDTRRLRVDGDRLLSMLDELGSIGTTGDGGVSRPAFTQGDREARQFVARLLHDAGLDARIDAAGNLIGMRPGRDPRSPALLMGSHIDTVPRGGRLDGAYGVLAAIEVARTLAENDVWLDRPIGVIVFSNEEGANGTRGMWGAHAFIGALETADLIGLDDDNRPVGELLAGVGGDAQRIAETAWRPEQIAGYLELHIEQGPVLERAGADIGVVPAITGRTTLDLVVTGAANHAGTTPMEARRDALVAAARLILAVCDIAGRDRIVRVATVGYCTVAPNAWNVIPGSVTLRADLRDVSVAAIEAGVTAVRSRAAEIANETRTGISVDVRHAVEPIACDDRMRELIADSADRLSLRRFVVPSGAGHDAQVVGRVAPVGMIFVPSIGGVSHAPDEATEPRHLVAGANVLLHTVLGF